MILTIMNEFEPNFTINICLIFVYLCAHPVFDPIKYVYDAGHILELEEKT